MKEKLKIRPYARLLTMLGDQLIKNETIALIELIKNSYDADADWVSIRFINLEDELKSKIIIEDNGDGMTPEIIKKSWMNPATPEKYIKKNTLQFTQRKKRIIQGEKGIGRFATLKLGYKIRIITRSINDPNEYVINYDFSKYDKDFLTENNENKELFLDELDVLFYPRKPIKFIEGRTVGVGRRKKKCSSHGTIIEIEQLKGKWSDRIIERVYKDVSKLESIFRNTHDSNNFTVGFSIDGKPYTYPEEYREKLQTLLTNNAVFRIEEGLFNNKTNEFHYRINDIPKVLNISDPNIKGLYIFRKRFGVAGSFLKTRNIACGSFNFSFYIFDFSPNAPAKYLLDKNDKIIIKDHRIYLYRDGIRVYPYGDPNDDWLQIDMFRGTISAAHFLSNDQVVGIVEISQKENPKLIDKTNREGLIEEGDATEDFITLIQVFLAYIRQHPYAQYRKQLEQRKIHNSLKYEQLQLYFNKLSDLVENDHKASQLLNKIEKNYNIEHKYLLQRAETTEELAGVGLSVETASHDIMSIMSKALLTVDDLIKDFIHGEVELTAVQEDIQKLKGMLSFIEAQLKDIQLLFKSSKQRRKNIRINDIIEKVLRIYKNALKNENVTIQVEKIGSPLIAKTTDAVLLQLFINLFDNSLYWLQQINQERKRIKITLDGNNYKIIFSDSGPGVNDDDKPYIFEPFFSGKGEEGRGLGLYIARQLLERNDYSIELADLKSDKILPGANFIISLVSEEN